MTLFRVIIGVVATVAWIPVLLFFFRNFKERRNPVSLAIGTLIALAMLYIGPGDYWLTSETANAEWVFLTFDVLSIAVSIHFVFAIRWSQKKFKDARRPTDG